MSLESLNKEGLIETLGILTQQVREAAEYLRIGEVGAAKSVLDGALKAVEALERDESDIP